MSEWCRACAGYLSLRLVVCGGGRRRGELAGRNVRGRQAVCAMEEDGLCGVAPPGVPSATRSLSFRLPYFSVHDSTTLQLSLTNKQVSRGGLCFTFRVRCKLS